MATCGMSDQCISWFQLDIVSHQFERYFITFDVRCGCFCLQCLLDKRLKTVKEIRFTTWVQQPDHTFSKTDEWNLNRYFRVLYHVYSLLYNHFCVLLFIPFLEITNKHTRVKVNTLFRLVFIFFHNTLQ